MTNNSKSTIIFSGELWQATMIKNMLDENGIPAFLENELMGTIAPWRISAGGVAPVTVIIEESHRDEALKLIDDFNQADFSENDPESAS